MKKTFVFDTNVLIDESDSIYDFNDNNVVLPLTVIEELGGLKKFSDERGHNAYRVIRKLEMEALTYLKGKSILSQFIIIDEAQNLTPLEVKTIISRAGKETKVIVTGAPNLIDNPYLDPFSNGVTYRAEKFKGQKLFAHVTLDKSKEASLRGWRRSCFKNG